MKEDHIFLSNGRVQIKEKKSMGTLSSNQMVLDIAWAKIPKHEGSISQSSFYGQLPDY